VHKAEARWQESDKEENGQQTMEAVDEVSSVSLRYTRHMGDEREGDQHVSQNCLNVVHLAMAEYDTEGLNLARDDWKESLDKTVGFQ
jgi:hypothetical protein